MGLGEVGDFGNEKFIIAQSLNFAIYFHFCGGAVM
jgi:hypothetical protein